MVEQGIRYPLLSDIDAVSVIALYILNTEHQSGENAYGIPYPCIFVVTPDGLIAGKIFMELYSVRVDAAGVVRYAEVVQSE